MSLCVFLVNISVYILDIWIGDNTHYFLILSPLHHNLLWSIAWRGIFYSIVIWLWMFLRGLRSSDLSLWYNSRRLVLHWCNLLEIPPRIYLVSQQKLIARSIFFHWFSYQISSYLQIVHNFHVQRCHWLQNGASFKRVNNILSSLSAKRNTVIYWAR